MLNVFGSTKTRAERTRARKLATVYFFAAGFLLIVMGLYGWRFDGIPMYYVGGVFVIYRIIGFFGVNIWRGGILDPINDPPEAPLTGINPQSSAASGAWPPPPDQR